MGFRTEPFRGRSPRQSYESPVKSSNDLGQVARMRSPIARMRRLASFIGASPPGNGRDGGGICRRVLQLKPRATRLDQPIRTAGLALNQSETWVKSGRGNRGKNGGGWGGGGDLEKLTTD